MNRPQIPQLFLLAGIVVFSACQLTPNKNLSRELKNSSAKLIVKKDQSPEEQYLMIYDLNKETGGLELRPVKIAKPSGHKIKDALFAFFSNNHFLEPVDSNQLVKIVEQEGKTTLYMAETENMKNNLNTPFFKEALEMTLQRNFAEDIDIVINEFN